MKPSKLKKTEKGKLRIIGGQWRGRKLKVADKPGLRPTPDRLRETLFNWLAPCITGARCLDLFAGSGALGIEAASRGAARVVLLERDADCARNLAQQRELLAARHIQVICGDALQFLKDGAASAGSLEKKRQKAGPDKQAIFDIVFLDPPFGQNLLAPCCAQLEALGRLAEHAHIYLEMERDLLNKDFGIPDNWKISKHKTAGQTAGCLAVRNG